MGWGGKYAMVAVVICCYFRAQHHMRPTLTCPRDLTSSQHSQHSVVLLQIIQEFTQFAVVDQQIE